MSVRKPNFISLFLAAFCAIGAAHIVSAATFPSLDFVNDKNPGLVSELNSSWSMRQNLMTATQAWDARAVNIWDTTPGMVMPSIDGTFNPDATLYELNYSMLKACSAEFYQVAPLFDSNKPAADAPIADQLEYLFKMKQMAKSLVGQMWGQELPDMTYNDYVRIFTNATCCIPGTFNRANHGYNFGKCDACGYGYWCQGGTHRARCPQGGTFTATDRSGSIEDCTECLAGFYCPTTDKKIACEPGQWSEPGSDKKSACSCDAATAGYYYPGDGVKTECPAGSYCKSCKTEPTFCPAGTWSEPGATSLADCKPTFCKPDNAEFGVYCENGTRNACPNGFQYLNPTDNNRVRTFNNVCYECGWTGGSATPAFDTWGKYSFYAETNFGTTQSAWCRNNFENGNLTASKTLCPAGTWSNPECQVSLLPGSNAAISDNYVISGRCPASALECADCPAGFWCDAAGMWPMDGNHDCPAGYWCPKGLITFADHYCPAGEWSETGAEMLSQCLPSLCGDGKWCATERCPNGNTENFEWPSYWCDGQGQTNANIKRDCPAGYFCLTDDMRTLDGIVKSGINMCEPGYYCQAGSGQNVGYWNEDGTTIAVSAPRMMCPNNMWSLPGAKSVADCIETFCDDGWLCSNAKKELCPAGFYCQGGNPPMPCPIGKYCPQGTTSDGLAEYANDKRPAISCPAGTWTNGNQKANLTDCQGTFCGADKWCDWADANVGTADSRRGDCMAGYFCTIQNLAGGATRVIKQTCPAGWFCPGNQPKQACTPGTWSNETAKSADECFTCPAGDYCNACELGSPGCENGGKNQCPAGFYCPAGATSLTECPAGKYCELGDRYAPRTCPYGTTSASGSSRIDQCTTCPDGYECENGLPTLCPAGYTCDDGVKTLCQAGKYCTSGRSSGLNCPAGTWSLPGATNANQCTAAECGVGYWCDAAMNRFQCQYCTAQDDQTNCPIGMSAFCPGDGTKTACPANHYCEMGENNPVACPAGTSAPRGSDELADCQPCPAGSWSDSGGNCTACPAGKVCTGNLNPPAECKPGFYCPGGNATETPCAENTWSNAGAISCSTDLCGAGFRCNAASYGRIQCPAGYYCPSSSIQNVCPAGRFCPLGSVWPLVCPAGTFTNGTQSITSLDCTEQNTGRYYPATCAGGSCLNNATAVDQTICPAGHYCPQGASAPVACPAGTYAAGTSTARKSVGDCTKCAAGKWTDLTGQTSCAVACPAGFYCPGGIDEEFGKIECPMGHYCGAGSSTPFACGVGKYLDSKQGVDLRSCLNCPMGEWTFIPGSAICSDSPAGFYTKWTPPSTITLETCPAGYYCPAGTADYTSTPCAPGTWSEAGSTIDTDCHSMNPSNVSASALLTPVTNSFTFPGVPLQITLSLVYGTNYTLVIDKDLVTNGSAFLNNCGIHIIQQMSGTDYFWGGGRGLAVVCGDRWRVFNTDGTLSQLFGYNATPQSFAAQASLINIKFDALGYVSRR